MRRSRASNRDQSQPLKRLGTEIRVTNEEILSDLLYPARVPQQTGAARPKARR